MGFFFFFNLDEPTFLEIAFFWPFFPFVFFFHVCSTTFGSKILALKHFFPETRNKMKAVSLLGSFPGVTLSWNESRSLCSLCVFMCNVYGIPLRPHLPPHIQVTPWPELLAASPSCCRILTLLVTRNCHHVLFLILNCKCDCCALFGA